ncbi:hypothetical protein EDB86DRAFT_1342562 [Lactarius hatsudake]|nr:hypothetical protein EDB86DRAFT_1342562 [Lactarius hatsudake]
MYYFAGWPRNFSEIPSGTLALADSTPHRVPSPVLLSAAKAQVVRIIQATSPSPDIWKWADYVNANTCSNAFTMRGTLLRATVCRYPTIILKRGVTQTKSKLLESYKVVFVRPRSLGEAGRSCLVARVATRRINRMILSTFIKAEVAEQIFTTA